MANDFLEVALPAFGFLGGSERYHLAQQEVSPSFDNGFLLFESPILHLHIVRERGQFSVSFASASHPTKSYWYDFDIVRRLLDGATRYQPDASGTFAAAVPDSADALAALLQRYLSQAEHSFGADHLHATEASLNALQRERGRLIFR